MTPRCPTASWPQGFVGTSCQTGWSEHHEAPGMDIEKTWPHTSISVLRYPRCCARHVSAALPSQAFILPLLEPGEAGMDQT